MKLVVEIIDSQIFAYREEDTLHDLLEIKKERKGEKYDTSMLDEECCLHEYKNGYWVFDLVEPKRGLFSKVKSFFS